MSIDVELPINEDPEKNPEHKPAEDDEPPPPPPPKRAPVEAEE